MSVMTDSCKVSQWISYIWVPSCKVVAQAKKDDFNPVKPQQQAIRDLYGAAKNRPANIHSLDSLVLIVDLVFWWAFNQWFMLLLWEVVQNWAISFRPQILNFK